jgi:hypothetical protein
MSKTIALKRNIDETFHQFITRALQELKIISKRIKSIDVTYLNEETTYFIYNGNQIFLEKAENNFYEIQVTPLPSSFDIRYGCELETCFVLNCSTNEFDEYIVKKLKEKKEEKNYGKKLKDWKELIIFHLQKNLVPKFSKEFIKRFPYAYIMSYHNKEALYIDLKSGEVIYDSKKVDNYNSLQFAQDASVKCGDSNKNDTSLTVHCEIISPILNDISEIKLIYENIISETCNLSNDSAGFHVNVSIVEKNKEQTPIKLTPGILFEICKQWYPFEKKHYTEYRGQGSSYAKNISEMVDDTEFMKIIYEKKDGTPIEDSDILIPENKYGLRTLFAMKRIETKFTSLHLKKKIDVLEFRVFPSKNKMKELIDYTKKAISIIKKSMKNFLENYNDISYEYNSLISNYKETKYTKFKWFNFKGPLSYYKKLNLVLDNNENPLEMFRNYETKIDTPFLFFFTTKEKVKGIQIGEYDYTYTDEDYYMEKIHIKYLPEENLIEISDYDLIYNYPN